MAKPAHKVVPIVIRRRQGLEILAFRFHQAFSFVRRQLSEYEATP